MTTPLAAFDAALAADHTLCHLLYQPSVTMFLNFDLGNDNVSKYLRILVVPNYFLIVSFDENEKFLLP